MPAYLFLFGVQLKALCQRAGLRLHVLLLHLTHALSVRDVFIFGPFEQAAGQFTAQGVQTSQRRCIAITLCISV